MTPRRIGWFLSLQDVWLTTTAHIAYEFMKGHDTIVSIRDELKECLPWPRYGVRGGVEGNGGTNDKSMWEGQITN
jgi:hypothetical protein